MYISAINRDFHIRLAQKESNDHNESRSYLGGFFIERMGNVHFCTERDIFLTGYEIIMVENPISPFLSVSSSSLGLCKGHSKIPSKKIVLKAAELHVTHQGESTPFDNSVPAGEYDDESTPFDVSIELGGDERIKSLWRKKTSSVRHRDSRRISTTIIT